MLQNRIYKLKICTFGYKPYNWAANKIKSQFFNHHLALRACLKKELVERVQLFLRIDQTDLLTLLVLHLRTGVYILHFIPGGKKKNL